MLAETDLGLRTSAAGLGRTVMVPDAVVTSRTRLRAARRADRRPDPLRRQTTLTPPDDAAALLGRAGFEVVAQRNRRISADPDDPGSSAVLVPAARGATRGRHRRESPPRLRWAIDIAAPAAAAGRALG